MRMRVSSSACSKWRIVWLHLVREDPSVSLNLCSNCRRSVSSLQTAAIYTISDFDEKILSIRKIVFLTITFNVNTNATSARSVPHQFIRKASDGVKNDLKRTALN